MRDCWLWLAITWVVTRKFRPWQLMSGTFLFGLLPNKAGGLHVGTSTRILDLGAFVEKASVLIPKCFDHYTRTAASGRSFHDKHLDQKSQNQGFLTKETYIPASNRLTLLTYSRTAAQSRNFHISTPNKNPPKPGISVRGDLCSSF